jgi:hypothetical protein
MGITAPDTDLDEDAAVLDEVRAVRPGVRIVILAPRTTPLQVIAALRGRVFACFSAPFDAAEIADMVAHAVEAVEWKDGIEVLSATLDWIHVRVNCRLLSAERLLNFLTELRSDVPEEPREDFMCATPAPASASRRSPTPRWPGPTTPSAPRGPARSAACAPAASAC